MVIYRLFILLVLALSLNNAFAQRKRLVYFQDFGCNDSVDAIISDMPVDECIYPQLTTDGSYSRCYAVRKIAYYNARRTGGSQWYRQIDHTFPSDSARGCFLQVDCGYEREYFYKFQVENIRKGRHVEISLWVVNLYTAYQKKSFEMVNWPLYDPDFDLVVYADDGSEVARFRIGPIPADEALQKKCDFMKSASWQQFSFNFDVKIHTASLWFYIGNRVISSPGNDVGFDDIAVFVY